jgi:hypothetical protein
VFDQAEQFTDAAEMTLAALLDDFEGVRAGNLQELASWKLGADDLELTAEHPALGIVTLRQLLSTWVAHDLAHIAQITRVMARQYRDAVGPWRAYLSVMDR